jgi:uncharacterized protein YbaP (TraB family)
VIEKGIAMKPGRIAPPSATSALLSPTGAGRRLRLATGLLVLSSLSWLIPGAVTTAVADERQGIYWQISQAGRQAGFLLGTIHSEDPRVVDFSESLIEELKSCQVFAMEMVPDLPTLKKLTEYMHYPEPDRLQSLLGQQRYDRTMQALSGYQVPNDWKARMKVWAVMMTLSVPAPQTGFFMDLSLSLRAAGSGLDVIGLETLEQQLQFLEEMPLEYQLELLDHALDDYQRVGEIHDEMVQVYLQDNLQALDDLSSEQFAVLDEKISSYFVDLGINARNHQMVKNALPKLAEGRVFIAVGALHLPGPEGLIHMLRQAGYELQPLPMPFNTTQVDQQQATP